MAFTTVERDSILGYLGYSVTASNVARVAKACADAIAASADCEARVRGYLNTLAMIETEIASDRSTIGGAYSQLKSEARVFVGRIGIALNLEVDDGVF